MDFNKITMDGFSSMVSKRAIVNEEKDALHLGEVLREASRLTEVVNKIARVNAENWAKLQKIIEEDSPSQYSCNPRHGKENK
jgi:hypothetical protein